MKTITARSLHHQLAEVLTWVEEGEEVQITRHSKSIACIVPVSLDKGSPSAEQIRNRWSRTIKGKHLPASIIKQVCEERHRD